MNKIIRKKIITKKPVSRLTLAQLIAWFLTLIIAINVTAANLADPKNNSEVTSVKLKPKQENNSYKLVLFYSATCKHCLQFCQTLKEYALWNKIPVIAFKLTPNSLPYFPDSILGDQTTLVQYFGQGAQIAVPTLFILNSQNSYLYPVSRGNLTARELQLRLEELQQKIKTFEDQK